MDRRLILSPESAEASDIFDKFCSANTLKGIIFYYRQLCRLLRIKPTHLPDFYPRLKEKLCSWRAQGLWTKIEKRASANCYARGKICASNRVLIIGGGPCGLRTAIEAQLLGAKVVLIEKRDRFSRNNVLHLWPFVITDLKALGAKKFYGKFCAGSIDHISIRQLQCLLLKVALLLGVEIHEGVGFERLIEPTETEGWKAVTVPADHPVSQYHFDCLVGADGRRNTLDGFRRKALRAKLAIAITANYINKRSEGEARVKEISGVSYIFNQKFFQDLNEATGIDLENIVYYKDETHYFVMTAKKHSLLNKGVLLQDHTDTAKLLSPENISREKLMIYAMEAAIFSTENQLTDLEFAVNHYGQPDVAMFDFTAMYAAENASRVVQRKGQKLLMTLVGDSLLEPFWPTGSGCARGFLSSFDASWMLRSWAIGNKSILEVIAERESIYRLLGQTTPENLNKEHQGYTIDPHSRYPNLNLRAVMPFQVKTLMDTDDKSMEITEGHLSLQPHRHPTKRRNDGGLDGEVMLDWLRSQVVSYGLQVNDVYDAFLFGDILSAIIYRFRPDLIDFPLISQENVEPLEMAASRNQIAFDLLQAEYGIQPILTGTESVRTECLEPTSLLVYLCEIYEAFKGEIPQVKYPRADTGDDSEETSTRSSQFYHQTKPFRGSVIGHKHTSSGKTIRRPSRLSSGHKSGSGETELLSESSKRHRKRKSEERAFRSIVEDKERRRAEIESNRLERDKRRMRNLILQRERFLRSMHLLQLSERREESEAYEDYTMHLYRQTAPEWEQRCKKLEEKLFSSCGKEERSPAGGMPGLNDVEKCVPGLARDLEQKLKGTKLEKKPKDLLRAIGKIEKSDWNVQLIEKKIAESKQGSGNGKKDRDDKVPKWSKEAFDDKREAMKRRMEGGQKGLDESGFEETMKNLGRRLKEGNALDVGQRGSNKVSQMAFHIVDKFQKDAKDKSSPTRTVVTRPLFEPKKPSSELCHFCEQRVYVVERMTAEGRFFHRNCFRCEYCNTSLRLGNYSFDRGGRYGERFYCSPHFHYISHFGWKKYDDLAKKSVSVSRTTSPSVVDWIEGPDDEEVDVGRHVNEELLVEMEERGTTPERIEFENSVDLASEEELLSEMDEDEWTDRNFGPSQGDNNTSDEASELSEEEEDQVTPEGNQHDAKTPAPDGEKWEEESDSDTEVASGETSSEDDDNYDEDEDDDDEEEECGGSTTEIETDSEFAEDPPLTLPGNVPTIIVDEPEPLLTRFLEIQPKGSPIHRPTIVSTKPTQLHDDPPAYKELILEEPLPRVVPRALPRVYAIPKKWEPLYDQGKKALELKTMYLHGPIQPLPGTNVKKVVDTATQNQFSSVLDMISEQQKRLQPAPKPSPAMQAFLEGTDKLKNRYPQPITNNQVAIPRATQMAPWPVKLPEATPQLSPETLSNNRINIEKTQEAESVQGSGLSPLTEKGDAEKEVSSPSTMPTVQQPMGMQESYESSDVAFLTSESATTTTVLAAGQIKDDSTAESSGELTVSDLEDDLPGKPLLDPVPPRLALQDEFGTNVAVDLGDEHNPGGLPSSDSKDSLNSTLFLETEMSEWSEGGNGCEKGRRGKPIDKVGLDYDSMDYMDMDGLSSPDEVLQSLSRRNGYSRLGEEGVYSPTVEEVSWSSISDDTSKTTTPTLPTSPSPVRDTDDGVPPPWPTNPLPPESPVRSRDCRPITDLFPIYLPPDESTKVDPLCFQSPTEFKSTLGTVTSPNTARKLDQLSKERAKESELIKLLVLGRITKNRRHSPPSSSTPSSSSNPKDTPRRASDLDDQMITDSNTFKVPQLPLDTITDLPTPVDPIQVTTTKLPSPISSEWSRSNLSKGETPAFYGSLPNISLLTNGIPGASGTRVTKVSSFLRESPKKWEDYKHTSSTDRLKARAAARDRARMKSDAELGLADLDIPYSGSSKRHHKLLERKFSQPEGTTSVVLGTVVEPFRSEPPTPLSPTGEFGSDRSSVAASIRHNVDFPMSRKYLVPKPDETQGRYKRAMSIDSKLLSRQ